jgi:hypothetical protein
MDSFIDVSFSRKANVLKYFLFSEKKKRPENLEKLFKAMKTIPATLIEAKRAFSSAGIFITKLRNMLSPTTIDALILFATFNVHDDSYLMGKHQSVIIVNAINKNRGKNH